MTSYAWVTGSPFRGDPDKVKEELDRIERTGGLTPEAVVVVARMKKSPLHKLIFDNTTADEALEKYHLARATTLLRSLVEVHEGEVTTIRPFVRILNSEGREWVSVALPEARDREIARLRGTMMSLKRRLRDLQVYDSVAASIEEALAA